MPRAFLEPIVHTDVTPDMSIANEVVFGPALSILNCSDDAQAIEIANGTPYGLVGGVFARDLDRATHATRKLRAGQVFVNEWSAGGVETPLAAMENQGMAGNRGAQHCGIMCRPRMSPSI